MNRYPAYYLATISWVGALPYARHYYGRLQVPGYGPDVTIKYPLSRKQAAALNKEDREHCRNRSLISTWESGEMCDRFFALDDLHARATLWVQENASGALLFVGERSCLDPMQCLHGPDEIKDAANRLYADAEAVGWWEGKSGDKSCYGMKAVYERWKNEIMPHVEPHVRPAQGSVTNE